MSVATQVFGQRAEAYALSWFIARGYIVIDRNWRCRMGEIDLIVRDKTGLHFVEVKARATTYEHPLSAISTKKRYKLGRAVEAWLIAHHAYSRIPYQVDAFCLWRDSQGVWTLVLVQGI